MQPGLLAILSSRVFMVAMGFQLSMCFSKVGMSSAITGLRTVA